MVEFVYISTWEGGVDMPLTEAKKKSNEKYFKENWKQVKLSMPNNEADIFTEYCDSHNISKAGFIRNTIKYATCIPDSALDVLNDFFERNNITEDSKKVQFIVDVVLDHIGLDKSKRGAIFCEDSDTTEE